MRWWFTRDSSFCISSFLQRDASPRVKIIHVTYFQIVYHAFHFFFVGCLLSTGKKISFSQVTRQRCKMQITQKPKSMNRHIKAQSHLFYNHAIKTWLFGQLLLSISKTKLSNKKKTISYAAVLLLLLCSKKSFHLYSLTLTLGTWATWNFKLDLQLYYFNTSRSTSSFKSNS